MPFEQQDLEAYLKASALAEAAKEYARQASRGLARDIGQSSYPTLVCQPPAPKMGTIVNCESRTVEGAYVARLELDPNVDAYYEQPGVIEVIRHSKRGRARRTVYCPDFLVLKRDEVVVVQTKSDAELTKKCAETPMDWVRLSDGTYVDAPAREAFEILGLRHIVVSSAQLPKVETTNLRTLLRVRKRAIAVSDTVRRTCARFISRNGVASLQQLLQELQSENTEPVYALLLDGALQTDLTRTLLTQTESCLVTTDRQLLRQDIYDMWIASKCCKAIASTSDSSATVPQQQVPCEKQLLRAIENQKRLKDEPYSRSARRWRRHLLTAERKASEIAMLTPAWHRSGNRRPKRHPDVLTFLDEYIRQGWTSDASPSSSALYRSYLDAAKERHPGRDPVSVVTFRHRLQALKPSLARKRGGTRAANAAASPSAVEDRAIRAQRPFEVAHCDHYNVNLYCIVRAANGAHYVARPLLTGLIDACTGEILVACLTLLPPSRRTCSMLLRMCLRLHGRLPESVIVDGGSDFQSTYFSAFMAHCEMELIIRPKGHGWYGSEMERAFGQFKEFWLAARPGNTARLKDDRAVSKEFKAHARARLTFEQLAAEVPSYVGWSNNRCPKTAKSSPLASREELLIRFPFSGIVVPDDEVFRIASAVDGGFYRVDPSRGMHIGHYHYWAPELACVNGRKRKVEVRFDPEDPYLVYALVEKRWVPCLTTSEATHDTVKDPVVKLARAILAMESQDARRVAYRDAEIELARCIRKCNETEAAEKAAKADAPAPSAAAPAPNVFERVRQEPITALTTSNW